MLKFMYQQGSEPRFVEPWLRITANLVLALYLALFMSGASSYVGAGTSVEAAIFSVLFYAIYTTGAGLAFIAFIRGFISYRTLVVSEIVGVVAVLPAFLGDTALDALTKNYVASLASLVIFPTVARLGDRRSILTFAATLTCVLSLICLLDACFLDGFTNTTGRAAGFLVNPNVAGLALLLFATGSLPGVPVRWRPAFLVLVAGAVMVTLSRSSLLIGACALVGATPAMRKAGYPAGNFRRAAPSIVAVVAILLSFYVCALTNNKAFSVAAGESFGGIRTTAAMWQNIQRKVKVGEPSVPRPAVAQSDGSKPTSSGSVVAVPPQPPDTNTESQVTPQLLAEAEHENSAVARGVVAERALDAYRSGPKTGRGLSYAFLLAPHNSFLLFAVAFGILGWLIIPLFVVGLLVVPPWKNSLPFVVLVVGGSSVSHDLYLSVPLVAGLVLLLISVGNIPPAEVQAGRSKFDRLPFTAASFVAFFGGVLIFFAQYPSKPVTFELQKSEIRPLSGQAYFAVVPPAEPRGLMRIDGIAGPGVAPDAGLKATEDDKVLGPASASLDDVISLGAGRYGYENMWFVFSSSDGSDPTRNDRSYRMTTVQRPHPLFYFALAVLLGWCLAVFNWSRRTNAVRGAG